MTRLRMNGEELRAHGPGAPPDPPELAPWREAERLIKDGRPDAAAEYIAEHRGCGPTAVDARPPGVYGAAPAPAGDRVDHVSYQDNCPDCAVAPGSAHEVGCDVERCVLCGRQLIGSCCCVYGLNGIEYAEMERTHPEVYERGATGEMWARYDVEVTKYGGRLAWDGEWPGSAECRELGWYSRWVEGEGWVRCAPDDAGAGYDLNRLVSEAKWSRERRRFVLEVSPGEA